MIIITFEYNQISLQWCGGKSANVVWTFEGSSLKALWNLSRPISQSDDDIMSENTLTREEKREKILAMFQDTPNDTPIDVKELGITVPTDGGPWRIGKPSDLENWKTSDTIFMRLARKSEGNPVTNRELNDRNFKLRREGGIISSTRKRRIQQAIGKSSFIFMQLKNFKDTYVFSKFLLTI